MDLLEKLVGEGTGGLILCGALLVLGTCVLPMCAGMRVPRQDGEKCRPDEPHEIPAKAKITSLRVYPVKSCAGHEVQQASLGDRGLEMDRQWMIVDGRGRFMSQRRFSKLALISPSLPKTKDEPLVLSAPGVASLEVPVVRKVGAGGPAAGGELVEVGVWKDTCQAIDQGDAAASWLQAFLGVDNLRLVRMKDGFVRPTDPGYGTGFRTGFADGFPMLLVAEESLEELNSRIAATGDGEHLE